MIRPRSRRDPPLEHRQLRQKIEGELKLQNYAPKTRKNYLGYLRRFFIRAPMLFSYALDTGLITGIDLEA